MSHRNDNSSRIGPYELGDLLRRTPSGPIVTGLDTREGERVWIQLANPARLRRADVRTRLLREAGGLRILDAANAIHLRSLEEYEGRAVIVYDALDGRALSALLREGPLIPAAAVDMVRQAAHGLHSIHRQAILHRGLRPETIWITRRRTVKLIDFELCDPGEDQRRSDDPLPLENLAHLAPEQIRGETADPRTDLYALGLVLVHALQGRSPFLRDTHESTIEAVLGADRSKIIDQLPPETASLRDLLRATLSVNRAERPTSAKQFIGRLDQAVGGATRALVLGSRRRFGERGPRWPFFALLFLFGAMGTWGVLRVRQQRALDPEEITAQWESPASPGTSDRIWLRTPENRTGRAEFDSLLASASARVRELLRSAAAETTAEGVSRAQRELSLLSGTLIRQPHRLRLQLRRLDPRTQRILDREWSDLSLQPTEAELVRSMRACIAVLLDLRAPEDQSGLIDR
jgi:hypothetical protein